MRVSDSPRQRDQMSDASCRREGGYETVRAFYTPPPTRLLCNVWMCPPTRRCAMCECVGAVNVRLCKSVGVQVVRLFFLFFRRSSVFSCRSVMVSCAVTCMKSPGARLYGRSPPPSRCAGSPASLGQGHTYEEPIIALARRAIMAA